MYFASCPKAFQKAEKSGAVALFGAGAVQILQRSFESRVLEDVGHELGLDALPRHELEHREGLLEQHRLA